MVREVEGLISLEKWSLTEVVFNRGGLYRGGLYRGGL